MLRIAVITFLTAMIVLPGPASANWLSLLIESASKEAAVAARVAEKKAAAEAARAAGHLPPKVVHQNSHPATEVGEHALHLGHQLSELAKPNPSNQNNDKDKKK